MIRNNINAVRTCHYPDQIPWYYLCDKAGIYVMAETNMEVMEHSKNLVRLNHRAAYLVLFRNGGGLLLTGLGVILKLLKTIQQFFSGL